MLDGHNAGRVTVLFSDVRNFSAISERLGPLQTNRFVNEALQALSECVLDEEGVIVDYVGDEIMAMWGGLRDEQEQADGESRAVRTALAMLDRCRRLTDAWWADLRETIDLGIGINTGDARVGNIGSELKFKYGPQGPTVNLAKRIQGLTRPLNCRLLVSHSTAINLPRQAFLKRRVCQAKLFHIHQPCTVYEVRKASPELEALFTGTEDALHELEQRQFREAFQRAGALLQQYDNDGPLLLILQRALEARRMTADQRFDPVWSPGTK
jgi:adenylate cyclase